jgi:ribosomal protein S9
MSNFSLYELTADYVRAIEQLATEEDQSKAADLLECIGDAFEQKAINVGLYMRGLVGQQEAIKAELARIVDLSTSVEAKRAKLEEYLERSMLAVGKDKIESPILKIGFRKNPPSVNVLDESAIPRRFFVQPPTPEPRLDKRALLAELKDGSVDGAELQQTSRLVIK